MRHYRCICGNVLFFDNSVCLQCGAEVGYDVARKFFLVHHVVRTVTAPGNRG